MLAMPPPGVMSADPWSDDVPVPTFGDVRPAHGVHALRHRRRRRPAELAGAAGAGEPDRRAAAVKPRSRDLSGEQRRALEILAGTPHGCTEEILRAHGFTVRLLAGIVRAGFAVAQPHIVKAGGRTLSTLRVTITDVGRQTLAGM
jgi:hypothetical protein